MVATTANEPFNVPGVSDWVRQTQQPGSLAYSLFAGPPPIVPMNRRNPRSGVDKTPPNQGYGSQDWWTTAGHDWQGNQTIQRNPTTSIGVGLPDWAQGTYADPRSFYEAYQAVDPSFRPAFVSGLQSAADARKKEELARDAALGTLGSERDRVSSALDEWRSDPTRQMVMERYSAMSAPDYQAITAAEQQAMRQQLAQGYARAQHAAQANAAGRGTGGSGVDQQRQVQLQAGADAGGVQVQAQIAAANQAARQRALQLLSGTNIDNKQVELAFDNLISGLSDQIAGYQTSLDYVPTDMTPWAALTEAKDQARTNAEFRDRELTRAEAESEDSVWDWVFKFVETFPGAASDIVGSVFGPGGGQ